MKTFIAPVWIRTNRFGDKNEMEIFECVGEQYNRKVDGQQLYLVEQAGGSVYGIGKRV